MRYFRASADVYAVVCQQLDAAYGYPNHSTKTLRTLPLPNDLPSDEDGNVYLAVSAEYCEYVLPSQMLPQLLAGGMVQELTEDEYVAIAPATTRD